MSKVAFRSIPIGGRFSLTNSETLYVNIKVNSSHMIGREHYGAFNAINLAGGEPRTFRDDEQVIPLPWVDALGYERQP